MKAVINFPSLIVQYNKKFWYQHRHCERMGLILRMGKSQGVRGLAYVLWNGRKTPTYISLDLLEPYEFEQPLPNKAHEQGSKT